MAGYLMFSGGGAFQKGHEQADLFMLQQAGGKEARVLIVSSTGGSAGGVPFITGGVNWFHSLGAVHVEALTVNNRAEADRLELAGQIAGANLIYLAGSNPTFLLEALQGSQVWAAIRQAFANGAALAGDDAGAMVIMEHLYDPANGTIMPGLGLLPDTIFVPYFNGYGRKWVPQIQKVLPGTLLIGVDEKVAIMGRGNDWQVSGRGWVAIYRKGKPYRYQGGQPFKMIP